MISRSVVIIAAFAALSAPMLEVPAVAQVSSIESSAALSAILNAGRRAKAVRQVSNVPSVGVIDLSIETSPGLGDDRTDAYEFRLSAEKNASGVHALQGALRRNPVTRAALAEHGLAVGRVVDVDIGSTGSLRLYVL